MLWKHIHNIHTNAYTHMFVQRNMNMVSPGERKHASGLHGSDWWSVKKQMILTQRLRWLRPGSGWPGCDCEVGEMKYEICSNWDNTSNNIDIKMYINHATDIQLYWITIKELVCTPACGSGKWFQFNTCN